MRYRHFLTSWLMLLAMAVQSFAGNVYWIGNAAPVAQKDTYTFTGSWSAADTVTVTMNNKSTIVTLGTLSAASNTTVAKAITKAINSRDTTNTLLDLSLDETKTIGGQQFPEFQDCVAKSVAGVITVTGTTDGRPFSMTMTETGGSGVITPASTAPTGPEHYNEDTNWDTGTAPASGDDVFFTQGRGNCLYGFADPNGDSALNSFTRGPGYSGLIGLSRLNTDHTKPYFEYRRSHLQIQPDASGRTYRISGGTRTNLDIVDENAVVHVDRGGFASIITGTGVVTLNGLSGGIKLGNKGADACVLGTMNVGNEEGLRATVDIASSCTFSTPALTIYEGNVTLDAAISTPTTLYKGTLTVNSGAQASIAVKHKQGLLVYNGIGTLTTLYLKEGGADFSGDQRSKIITNFSQEKGTFLWDPTGVVTYSNGRDLIDCGWHEVGNKTLKSRRWTDSAIP